MGKRLFAGFMTICMLLSVMPATVHAEEKPTEGELVGTQNEEMAAEEASVPVSVIEYNALVTALEEGKDVKLEADITAEGAVIVSAKELTIDLNSHKLTLTVGGNSFNNAANVTIKNGTIDITDVTASGDCIIGIGDYLSDGTLTLENVDVVGDGYSSAYAVFYVYKTSTLNIRGGSVIVENDNASAGGVLKAHSAANGKINISGTADDPVELYFTDAKIGILDGTVLLEYVDLNIQGGANAINQSALTVKNSTMTIANCDGRALTLNDGDVVVENSTLNFSGATEGEIRFKAGVTLLMDDTSSMNQCKIWADSAEAGAKVNDTLITGTETEMQPIVAANGNIIVGNAGETCAHKINAVAEVAATCNGTGTKAHYKCATCGKLYSDAAGTTEITAESLVIPKGSHSFGGYSSDEDDHWKACGSCGSRTSKGSHSFGSNGKCGTCGYQKQSDATSDSTPTTPSEPVLIALAPTTPSEDITAKSARTVEPQTEASSAEETTVETAAAVISEESLVAATALVEEAANEAVVEAVRETVTVTEEKAVVTTETVDKVIENTEAGATVILPLAEAAGEGKTVKEAEVPVESLEKVAEAEASLKVQFEDVEVIFDKETLHAITEQAEGSVIELRVVQIENNELKEEQQAALEGKDVQVTVAAQIYSNGKYIGDFKGGTATLAIPFEPEGDRAAEDYAVYYVADNGDMTCMVSAYTTGYMIVQVDHFSDYVIVYEGASAEETETPAAEEEPVVEEAPVEETAEEAGMPILPIIIIVVAVIAAVVFFMKKKNDEK